MTVDETNALCELAKYKKDGVYSYKGNLYAVKGHKFIAFANYYGEIFQRCYGFNVQLGKVVNYDRKKELQKLIKIL